MTLIPYQHLEPPKACVDQIWWKSLKDATRDSATKDI